MKSGSNCCLLPPKADKQGATASLADAKETSVDAAEAASLSESDVRL